VLLEEEYYHVYNRGAHKGAIFMHEEDYKRFLLLLLVVNTSKHIEMRTTLQKYAGRPSARVFEESFDKSLVDILSYSLMPNHFHLILRQKADDGISRFMKKLCTAYSMYFNMKYDHSGVLFQGRYKSVHIDNDPYFQYLFAYVHLNPVELVQPRWKEIGIKEKNKVRMFLSSYRYSSYYDYCVGARPEKSVLAEDDLVKFLKDKNDLEDLLAWESGVETPAPEDRPW